MELTQSQSLAIVLMTKHGLMKYGYKFQWDNQSRCFGAHNGAKSIIFLSRRLTQLNPESEVKDTILHEIAHALDYIRNGFRYRYTRSKRLIHDNVWKSICVEIGCRPHRCYTDKEVVSPARTSREIKWHIVHRETGEIYFKYKRRPKRCIWSSIFVKGREKETLGKLVLISATDTN